MIEDRMLTTYDNPFDPFENFDLWWKEDLRLGHDCCGTLARNAFTSEVLSDELNEKAIDEAIDYVISLDPLVYKVVYKNKS